MLDVLWVEKKKDSLVFGQETGALGLSPAIIDSGIMPAMHDDSNAR